MKTKYDVGTTIASTPSRAATIARNGALDSVPGLTAKEAFDKSVGATRAALRQPAHVVDAALGNSQYLKHFEEDYDWLMQTIEWRSYLNRIDPPVGSVEPSWYQSPEGLVYGADNGVGGDVFDTRVDHVLNHTRPILRDDDFAHGLFTTDRPLETVDEAFVLGGVNTTVRLPEATGWTIPANATDIYKPYPPVYCVRIGSNSNGVLTAFPLKC